MSEEKALADKLEDVLREKAPAPGMILTDFVLITEWADPDGSIWLTESHSDMTQWKRDGILNYALNTLADENDNEDDD